MLHTVLAGRVEPMVRPWMVVLADTRVLGQTCARTPREPDPAVMTLASHGVPVILVSFDPAERVRAVQSALGIRSPFICGGGTELHVPGGYFDEMRCRQVGALLESDHPAHNVATEQVEDHIQRVIQVRDRPLQFGNVPRPDLIRRRRHELRCRVRRMPRLGAPLGISR